MQGLHNIVPYVTQVVKGNLTSCQQELSQADADNRRMQTDLTASRQEIKESSQRAGEQVNALQKEVADLQGELASLQAALQQSSGDSQVTCPCFADGSSACLKGQLSARHAQHTKRRCAGHHCTTDARAEWAV